MCLKRSGEFFICTRRYGLSLTLAHQYLARVPEGLREAAFGNCGSLIALRVGAEDAALASEHLALLDEPAR